MKYEIVTERERYSVDAAGLIGRPSISMAPSGQWRILGAVRRNNFGAQVAFVPFPACGRLKDWRYKNGKARWKVRDLDHGAEREWGEVVHTMREVQS